MAAVATEAEELLYDAKNNAILFTPIVEEHDIVVRGGVKLRNHGVLVVVDDMTRCPVAKGTEFDPATHIVVWRATAGDDDSVVASDHPAVITGSVVLRPHATAGVDQGKAAPDTSCAVACEKLPVDAAPLTDADGERRVVERKGGKRARDGAPVARSANTGAPLATSAAAADTERRGASSTLQLTVSGKGGVRRSHLHAVVMACIADLNLASKYVTKTQPCGLKKIAFVGNGPEKRFASLQECVTHLKQCSGVDIVQRLASVPATFPTVEAMPAANFVSSGVLDDVSPTAAEVDAPRTETLDATADASRHESDGEEVH